MSSKKPAAKKRGDLPHKKSRTTADTPEAIAHDINILLKDQDEAHKAALKEAHDLAGRATKAASDHAARADKAEAELAEAKRIVAALQVEVTQTSVRHSHAQADLRAAERAILDLGIGRAKTARELKEFERHDIERIRVEQVREHPGLVLLDGIRMPDGIDHGAAGIVTGLRLDSRNGAAS